jgi:predicted MFS family arabinose efflux permease
VPLPQSRPGIADYVGLVRANRNFRLLWVAQIISEIGDWFYSAAVITLLLQFTGRAESVGLVLVLQVLPQVLAAPTAGILNDRLSRKLVMIATDWARCAVVAGMLFVRSPEMVGLAYVLMFFETIFWAHFEPARNSVIPNITTPDELHVANTLSSATWSFNFTIGFALGGLAAAFLGRPAVFAMNSASFAASALLVSRMRFRESHAENRGRIRACELVDFSKLVEGLRYIRRNPRLVALIFVKGGVGLSGTNWVLLTILGKRVFPVHLAGVDTDGAGMLGMSILMGSRGIGSFFAPLIGNRLAGSSDKRLRQGILTGFLLAAAGYMLLSQAHSLSAACLCIAVAHGGIAIAWVFSSTLAQLQTEDAFRGRVSSAEFALLTVALSLTSYSAGVAIDAGLPIFTLAFVCGAMMIVPAVGWAATSRLWSREAESDGG